MRLGMRRGCARTDVLRTSVASRRVASLDAGDSWARKSMEEDVSFSSIRTSSECVLRDATKVASGFVTHKLRIMQECSIKTLIRD